MKRDTMGLCAALLATAGLAALAPASAAMFQPADAATEPAAEEKKHDEKALEVIDNYVEKIGGRDLVMSIKSMHTVGTLSIPMAGMTGKLEMFAAQPGRMASVMELPGMGKIESGYDGEYGWSSDPMSGPRLMSEEEVADLSDQMDPNSAAKHREVYKVIEHAGEVEFEGQKAHKIRLVRKNDRESFEYYSIDSGLLIGQEMTQASQMGDIKVVAVLSDYKEFDGMKMPTKITQKVGPQEMIMTISEVNLNEVDDKVFKRPPAVEALVEAQKEG